MSEILNNQIETIYGINPDLPSPNVPFKDYDTVTIKHLIFVAEKASDSLFLLWCSYNNSYVTSFTIDDFKFHTDEPRDIIIKLNKNTFEMKFTVFSLDKQTGALTPYTDKNVMSITPEFNKYKK